MKRRTMMLAGLTGAAAVMMSAAWAATPGGKTAGAAAEKPAWKAAAVATDITPTKMIWMGGYASRTKPADGVTTELFAKTLAVEDEAGGRMVIVTLDLIGVPRELRDAVEMEAEEKYRLPREALLLNASHTHSGPELRVDRMNRDGRDERQVRETEEYRQQLQRGLVDSIGRALEAMEPARLNYQRARCGFAMNRRRPTAEGFQNAPNPDGPVDHDVPVLTVRSADGKKVKAVMFGYACHNTTLGLQQFNADYAGYAQTALEEAMPGTAALFVMGAGGDQNPYPRRKLPYAEQHGRSLANAVLAAMETPATELRGPVRSRLEDVTLDFAPVDRAAMAARKQSGNKYEAAHADRVLRALEEGTQVMTLKLPVQAVRFGEELTLVAIGGEVVVDYSLRLKREIGGAVWVAGYSNHVFGYLPSLRVLKEGGYEGGGAMNFTAYPGPFAETVEERVVGKVHELVKSLGGTVRAARGS